MPDDTDTTGIGPASGAPSSAERKLYRVRGVKSAVPVDVTDYNPVVRG
jgi:hypothetical protein